MGPDTGEEVGLQLHADGELVVVAFRKARTHRLHLVGDAELILHVVADFVRDHISLGEVAGRAEAAFEFVVEGEVDVHLLVERAIEGAGGGAGHTAGAADLTLEEHERGRGIAAAEVGRKKLAPDVFIVGEHHPHELREFVVERLAGGLLRCRCSDLGRHLGDLHRIDSEEHQRDHEDQREQTSPHHHGRGSLAATILDVLTLPTAFPTHGRRSSEERETRVPAMYRPSGEIASGRSGCRSGHERFG